MTHNKNNSDGDIGGRIGLTREDADRLYRATGPIDAPEAILADFVARSRAYREGHRGILSVQYGPTLDETLDVFLPASGCATAPVHIFIHGGYWYQFGKDEWSFVAEALTDANAIVVIPRYSLCPKVVIAEIVRQMRTVIHWVWHNISRYGGDRERLFVSGHSAGAHLAMELLLTDWEGDLALPADVISGVTAISGLYDLRPVLSSYVQDHVGLSLRDAERLSPLERITASSTPLIVAVAEADPEGFHMQTAWLIEKWQASGSAVTAIDIAGHNHLTELYELSRTDGVLARAIRRQMALPEG